MLSFFKEFLCVSALALLGSAYGLLSGLSPHPWAAPTLPAGAIEYTEATVLDPIWLDARPIEAFEQAQVPGAQWLNPTDWESGIPALMEIWLQHPRPIIIYCNAESCNTSRDIAVQMREALPQAEIYYLHGGWPNE